MLMYADVYADACRRMQVADSLRFPRIKSLPDNDDPDFELLGSLQTPYQWGFELCADGISAGLFERNAPLIGRLQADAC